MGTRTYTGTIITTECWCGITHGVPKALYDHMLQQKNNGEHQSGIYCPLGHSWTFAGKGTAELERERRERLEKLMDARTADLKVERAAHAATKGQLTKTKNRVSGGACPCCNRTFVQLGRHMKTKHPDYATQP